MTGFKFISTAIKNVVDTITLDPGHVTGQKALTTLRVVAVDAS